MEYPPDATSLDEINEKRLESFIYLSGYTCGYLESVILEIENGFTHLAIEKLRRLGALHKYEISKKE